MFDFQFSRQAIIIVAAVAALSGCASMSKPVSIADTLATTPELSTLNSLVAKAGLADTLKGTGPLTVFAPTNAAFAKVPAKTMEDLSKDPARLKTVLTYHVIPARVMATDVKNNSNVKTINGANLGVSKAGTFVTVEDAMVEKADMTATNGVVHVIDSVLIPPVAR
ncbi:MAG: fasciclin domain-containing protein [Polaromonas sp.]|nr:MAG: fasciclin domain-containing protein [Polaromonas sp.]